MTRNCIALDNDGLRLVLNGVRDLPEPQRLRYLGIVVDRLLPCRDLSIEHVREVVQIALDRSRPEQWQWPNWSSDWGPT